MAMIFRQPGETGIGNLKAGKPAGSFNGNNCHSSSNERKRTMKLNSIIFCLCAGLCSSALIENAFSMNCSNRFCKLDKYSAMIVSKYFETKQDFVNLGMVNSKFRENMDRFHYNPISIAPKDLDIWPRLETLHLYTDEDIDAWEQAPNDINDLHKIEVWPCISDEDACQVLIQLDRLIDKHGGSTVGVTFRNVELANTDILGSFDEAWNYTFNENVYTNGERGKANFVITSIDEYAFCECEDLKSITIPNSVTSIGDGAFAKCLGLTSITIPTSVKSIGDLAFNECSELTSITIPTSIKSIADQVFDECCGLKSITIPDSVTSIGDGAFEECCRLTSVTIPDSVKSIESGAFALCEELISVTIPSSVTFIGFEAFCGCPLCTFTVPNNNIKEMLINSGESAYKITMQGEERPWWIPVDGKLIIPDDVESIENYMFIERADIASVEIPDSVTSIGDNAFSWCKNLTSVTIPDSVTSIGGNAFYWSKSLKSVTIPDSVTSIGCEAFNECSACTFTVPNNDVKKMLIASGVNKYRIALQGENLWWIPVDGKLIIYDGVESIEDRMFAGRADITSVEIPDSVTSIGGGAFSGCTGLTSIVIPDSVTYIGNGAFYGCDNLRHIYVYSDRVRDLVVQNRSSSFLGGVIYIKPSIVKVIKK